MNANTEEFDNRSEQINREKLVQDLKTVVRDAEDLIKATAGELGEKTKEARQRLTSAIQSAQNTLADFEARARAGVRVTDRLIRENPYPSVGIAFFGGLLLGALLNRR
jgi:ElaB/YqjD/DUF883 family membrane-anchored ribosome-binding protein